ncbi:FAD-binding protein, partial [Acinetobacter nosocomialis]
GGRLINAQGERFMSNYDDRLELAPRDVVARSIIKEAQRTAQGVFLDISHQSDEFIRLHFPKIYQSCLAKGVD